MRTSIHLKNIIIFFVGVLIPDISFGQQEYFYSTGGKKVYMEVVKDRFVVKPKSSITAEQVTELLSNVFTDVQAEEITGLRTGGFYEIRFDSGNITEQQLTERLSEIKTSNVWTTVNPVYLIEGNPAIAYDIFVVNLHNESVLEELKKLDKKYNVRIVEQNELVPTMVTLQVPEYSEYQVTDLARIYYENLNLEWSTPDFKQQTSLHGIPNDSYYQYQFCMDMILAEYTWDITKGNNTITVAVIDEGVESHPDFGSTQLIAGYDAFGITNGAPEGNQSHGMASAGIIGANHNSQGIAGLSPNVKIMPIRIFNKMGSGTTNSNIASAISYAVTNGADIISNSWGYDSYQEVPEITTVIENAMQNGRDGKGTIFIFSSGNVGDIVRFPANIDGVVAVGAVDQNDLVFSYSCGGSSLDLVAPSGDLSYGVDDGPCGPGQIVYELRGNVWSLERNGNPGWNPGNYNITSPNCFHEFTWTPPSGQPSPVNGYTANFGGTSAACPQVSGTAALLLSINSSLYLSELRATLQNTADKVPGMNGQNFASYYGYGRLNAYKALKYAIENYGALLGVGMSQVTLPLWENMTLKSNVNLASNSTLTIEANNLVTISAYSGTVTLGGTGSLPKTASGESKDDTGSETIPTAKESLPDAFQLSQNYPNPFNPTTVIIYSLPIDEKVAIKIYDVLGREIAELVSEFKEAGKYSVTFDASSLASGVYFYRIDAGKFSQTKRLVLVK
jgi:subtilisin family serine protease